MKNVGCATAAFALLLATSALAQAQDGVLLDYTKKGFLSAGPTVDAADKARVSSALALLPSDAVKALGSGRVLLGHAKGKAPKAGDVDIFLLSQKEPIAAQPFPEGPPQVIVVLKGKDVVGTHVVPAGRQFTRLVGAVDLDGDNASEVLVEGAGYNMGQLIVALNVLKLEANGTSRIVQTIPEVYDDACEAPAGQNKTLSAKTISLRGGKLVESVHPLKCG